jgi:two-component system, NarL family, invasion response regulator UvrY
MIKVLVADDHAVVRRGIRNILSSDKEISITGEASCYDELKSMLDREKENIVILDITMPGKNGLDALIEIKERKPDIKVIILSMHDEEEIISRAFKTGASAYISKDCIPDELVKAVKSVHKGSIYIASNLAGKFDLQKSIFHSVPHHQLSKREYQILCLLASGNSLKEISQMLDINVKTVSTFRSRVLMKMNMKSNSEIASYALKHKLTLMQ